MLNVYSEFYNTTRPNEQKSLVTVASGRRKAARQPIQETDVRPDLWAEKIAGKDYFSSIYGHRVEVFFCDKPQSSRYKLDYSNALASLVLKRTYQAVSRKCPSKLG